MSAGNDDPRALRVFVSSTFRDMQAERDELVKRVFPRIRRMCEERGMTWSEVDLRWGVTDEQKAEGAVLPICLAEIDRTRPYFIGLLGQRYGWVPDEIPDDLARSEPWIDTDRGRSVTEMEIVHGVLDRPGQTGHAFFYLRDPAWLDTLPAGERDAFEEPDVTGRERLATLRARIRTSGHPTRDYADPTELGELVLSDLEALVERLAPTGSTDDAPARHDAVHRSFGQARHRPWVPRPDLEALLDAHAAGSGPPLLLTGEAGVGASALVTNWAAGRADARPDETVVVHHTDADAGATDARTIAARLMAAWTGSDLEAELESLADATPAAVRAALEHAAADVTGRSVVVLDGLDHLDDSERALDLRWFPVSWPERVRVVVTAREARIRSVAERQGWTIVEVPELDLAERAAVAERLLAERSKALDRQLLAALVAGERCGNARFLTTVVDELRQHGDHFTLGAEIRRLTAATSVDDLLELVLARYERDFDRDHPDLTRRLFTALRASQHGMAEAELRDLLGTLDPTTGERIPLPTAAWAPIHLAAERGVVSRGGLLAFAHDDLRRAVDDRYLADDATRRHAHATLADYFGDRPLGPRVADELAWQRLLADDLDGFVATMADLDHFELAYRRNPADVRRRWAAYGRLTGHYGEAIREAYDPVVADPAAHERSTDHDDPAGAAASDQRVWGVARLLEDAGEAAAARRLHRHLVDRARRTGQERRLRAALVNLGASELVGGDLDAAVAALTEAIERCRAADDAATLGPAMLDLAIAHRQRGDVRAAMSTLDDVLDLARQRSEHDLEQATLGERVLIHRQRGDYDAATTVLDEQERIARDDADPLAVDSVLAARATILADRGDLFAAVEQMRRRIAYLETEGLLRQTTEAELNLGATLIELGDTDGADAALLAADKHARALASDELLPRVLAARSGLAGLHGDWDTAEQLAREAELTARAAARGHELALALGHLGTARRERGDLDGAELAHVEELTLATDAGETAMVATARANLGNVAVARQRFDDALSQYDAALETLRAAGLRPSMLPVLANRAQVRQATGDAAGATDDFSEAATVASEAGLADATRQWAQAGMALAYQLGDVAAVERCWQSIERIARTTGDEATLQQAVGERALALIGRGEFETASMLLAEQEAICRRIGHDVGLAACVGNRAIVARHRGDLTGALALLDEQVQIATRSGNAQSALIATANRGEILGLLGRTDDARAALSQARQTAQQYGLAPMVQQLDVMLARLG